jgi:hypothetical protein
MPDSLRGIPLLKDENGKILAPRGRKREEINPRRVWRGRGWLCVPRTCSLHLRPAKEYKLWHTRN